MLGCRSKRRGRQDNGPERAGRDEARCCKQDEGAFRGHRHSESRQTCTDAQGAAYRCGQKAAQALDYRISDGVVTCEPKDRDRYGRIVAVCRAYGEDLSTWMTGLGWALAFRRYSTQYVPAEELAERRKAGMWSGQFVPPWEWRAEARGQTRLSTGESP